jgi:hypothetical protein
LVPDFDVSLGQPGDTIQNRGAVFRRSSIEPAIRKTVRVAPGRFAEKIDRRSPVEFVGVHEDAPVVIQFPLPAVSFHIGLQKATQQSHVREF